MMPRRTHTASRTHRGAAGLALAIALSAPVVARACPMCKDGAAMPAQQPKTAAPAEAAALDFNTSIYVMLGVVGTVGATVGRVMFKAVRG